MGWRAALLALLILSPSPSWAEVRAWWASGCAPEVPHWQFVQWGGCAPPDGSEPPTPPEEPEEPPAEEPETSRLYNQQTRSHDDAPRDVRFLRPVQAAEGVAMVPTCTTQDVELTATSDYGISHIFLDIRRRGNALEKLEILQQEILTGPPWQMSWILLCDELARHNYELKALVLDNDGRFTVLVLWVFSR